MLKGDTWYHKTLRRATWRSAIIGFGQHEVSSMSAFVESETFVDQLIQFIQLLLPDFQEHETERLIVNPLDLRPIDIDRFLGPRDNELYHELFSRLNNQTALDLCSSSREIDGLTLDLMRIHPKQSFDLRRNPTMLTPFHTGIEYRFQRRKARHVKLKSLIVRGFP